MATARMLSALFAVILWLTACEQSPQEAFEQARSQNSVAAYRAFIKEYPNSSQARDAQIALERAYLDSALASGEVDSVKAFMAKFPQSNWIPEAANQLEKIYSAAFAQAVEQNTIAAYEAFAEKYLDAPQAKQAQTSIERLRLDEAVKAGKVENLKAFLKRFPQSPWQAEAKKQIENVYRREIEKAKQENSIAAYEAFIKNYPDAPQIKEAQLVIRQKTAPEVANLAGTYDCRYSYYYSLGGNLAQNAGTAGPIFITQTGSHLRVDNNGSGTISEDYLVEFSGAVISQGGRQYFTGQYDPSSKTISGTFEGTTEEYGGYDFSRYRVRVINATFTLYKTN